MFRAAAVLVAAGAVGLWVTGILFSVLLPLVWMAVKVAFFIAIFYLIVRMINPDFANKVKEKCCGGAAFFRGSGS
ncbi:hypothetical protein [Candidatus Palauibacter sp.]|uniref:hypothetical protein n=1 Tax=Candidatus Palauibacter sp. TaxID=3101350 RepID=UPI003B51FC7A